MEKNTTKNENESWYKIKTDLSGLDLNDLSAHILSSFFIALLLIAIVVIYIFKIVPNFLDIKDSHYHLCVFATVSVIIAMVIFLLFRLLVAKTKMLTEEAKALAALKRKLIEDVQHREVLIQELYIKKMHNLEDKK